MKLWNDVSGVLLDMDGTVYLGDNPIDGAAEFIRRLKDADIPYAFITNNSSNTRNYYYQRLKRMGFPATEDSVITSAVAAAEFIKTERENSKTYVLASPEVEKELISLGVDVTDENPDIVLLTFDRTMTYGKLNDAYRMISDGAEFIATHPDMFCPTEDGYDVDIGPFITLLESLTGTKAKIIGKPEPLMLEMASRFLKINPNKAVMIGDRLYTDIKMAKDANIRSVLVLSGETSRDQLNGSDTRSTAVADSVADIMIPDKRTSGLY